VREFDPRIESRRPSQIISFALENGRDHLEPYFSEIEMYRYEDDLIIAQAGPLVAYVLSMSSLQSSRIDQDPVAFARFVEGKIDAYGAIRIAKDSGLFVAVRSEDPTDVSRCARGSADRCSL
jgi:hypothetical protein